MSERALQLLTVVAPKLDEEGHRAPVPRPCGRRPGRALPWELAVVDDGSTDATPQVLDELAVEDPRASTTRAATWW